MNSPLDSYTNPGGEKYLSDQPSFQKLQGDMQANLDKVIAKGATIKKNEQFLKDSEGIPEDSKEYKELYNKRFGPPKPTYTA